MMYNVEQDWPLPSVPFWSGFLGNTSFHVIYYINGVSGGKVNKKKRKKSIKRTKKRNKSIKRTKKTKTISKKKTFKKRSKKK